MIADLRQAVRVLRDSPGFALVAVLTLALGIGTNSAIFSVLNGVLLEPLPYEDPDRIVMLWGASASEGTSRDQVSATDVFDWRDQNSVFEEIGAFSSWRPILSGKGAAERVAAAQISEGFFDVLKGRALHGRLLVPEDQTDGNDRTVVLSHGFWKNRFGGDPGVIGSPIRLNLVRYTVVGVLNEGFVSLPAGLLAAPADLYRPVAEPFDESMRSARHLRAIARLKPGATLDAARGEMNVIAARLAETYPDSNADYGVQVVGLEDELVGGVRPTLLLLFGAVGFVLLTACVNVGNLLLARAATRRREIAVRSALGAGRLRIVRQLLTENLLLAALGGFVGLLLALWSLDLIKAIGVAVHPALAETSIDLRVVAFTLGLSLLTVLVFGLAPAWYATRPEIERSLRIGSGRVADGGGGLRNAFVVVQITLALVLLVGAGLVMRSVVELNRVDPGFEPANKLAMDIALPWKKYRTGATQVAFFSEAIERVRGLPGVREAGVVSTLPFSGFDRVGVEIEGRNDPPGREPSPDRYVVTPSYLDAMPIRVLRGRGLESTDRAGGQEVVLVSETMADSIWPGEQALGRRLRLPSSPDSPEPWRTVVGVVRDVKQLGLDRPGAMQVYLPLEQYPWSYMSLVVVTDSDAAIVAKSVRTELHRLDADVPLFNMARLEDLKANSISIQRFTMGLLTVFASVALTLAAIGIYGLFSFTVSRRTREIGVRIALGARRFDVLRLILGRGALLTAAGLAAGFLAAWMLTRFLSGWLYAVTPTDPVTFLAVAALLASVALAACWFPARRAAGVDPVVTLRAE